MLSTLPRFSHSLVPDDPLSNACIAMRCHPHNTGRTAIESRLADWIQHDPTCNCASCQMQEQYSDATSLRDSCKGNLRVSPQGFSGKPEGLTKLFKSKEAKKGEIGFKSANHMSNCQAYQVYQTVMSAFTTMKVIIGGSLASKQLPWI